MSKSILVVARYKNNKTTQRGLFDGINIDSNNSKLFSPNMVKSVFAYLDEDIKNRSIKSVQVTLGASDKHGVVLDETYKYKSVNDAENDMYKFLDKLNYC